MIAIEDEKKFLHKFVVITAKMFSELANLSVSLLIQKNYDGRFREDFPHRTASISKFAMGENLPFTWILTNSCLNCVGRRTHCCYFIQLFDKFDWRLYPNYEDSLEISFNANHYTKCHKFEEKFEVLLLLFYYLVISWWLHFHRDNCF